jgi:A/G-specific adenine glycosylase
MPGSFTTAEIDALRSALLAFFDASARDLPWRGTRDPYAIWVSEVMSQQTRIDTVIPYYERWMARFPDVAALADAPIDDVLKQWEGLGYYSRARNLHAAARLVRERHAGAVPRTCDALRDLPGVGEYTAGALASIAYGVPAPAVDGNARRVLARLLDEPDPSPARLRDVAAALVPDDRPGDFNQAVMELGAQVCTPRAPRCGNCPLSDLCAARAAGTQLERPRARTASAVPVHEIATVVLRAPDGRVLLVRRPDTGLLAGMWCFPGTEVEPGQHAADAAASLAAGLLRAGTPADRGRHIGEVRHAFSHRHEHYACFLFDTGAECAAMLAAGAVSAAGPADHANGCDRAAAATHWPRTWTNDMAGYALPRAQQKIHALVRAV